MTTKEWWYIFAILLCIWVLWGCVEEQNCVTTDEIDYYRTEETRYYTITEPVYKKICR
jgi:hypothetical protein